MQYKGDNYGLSQKKEKLTNCVALLTEASSTPSSAPYVNTHLNLDFFKKILQANKTSFFLFYWLPVSFTFIHIIIWYDVAAISFLSDLLIKRTIYNMLFRFRTFHCYNAGSLYFINAIIIPLQFKEDKRLACNACSYSDTVLKWFADNLSYTSQGMV